MNDKELEGKIKEGLEMYRADTNCGINDVDYCKLIIQTVRKHMAQELLDGFKKIKPGSEYGEYYWKDIKDLLSKYTGGKDV